MSVFVHQWRLLGRLVGLSILLAWVLPAATEARPSSFQPRVDLLSQLVWTTGCIHCPVDHFILDEGGLVLDDNGRPHVVFTGDRLQYAYFDGATWRREAIDDAPGLIGLWRSAAALALDAQNHPHISYLDKTGTQLKYAYKAGQSWQIETLTSAADGQYLNHETAIAVDDSGTVHIAYGDYGDLKHASQSPGGWDIVTVDGADWVEWYISIELDRDDRPHLSYYSHRADTGRLKYAHLTNTGAGPVWINEFVDTSAWLGEFNSLALDANDDPHISYLDFTNSQIKYAHRVDGQWELQNVAPAAWWGGFTAIALDGAGQPHISFGADGEAIRLASRTATGWAVTSLGESGWYTSLALDAQDRAHVAYFGWQGQGIGLKYARQENNSWDHQVVALVSKVGRHAALALDEADGVHVAYADSGGDQALLLAQEASGGWTWEAVDGLGLAGGHIDLALNAQGDARLSYVVGDTNEIRYAVEGASDWLTKTVASDGAHTALALDSAGDPHLIYYDLTQSALKYATGDGAGWAIATVDDDGDVGQFADLALDQNGRPHISYHDGGQGGLKYARWDGADWVITTVDQGQNVGQDTALALDSGERAHIAYYDGSNGSLRYARWTGTGWDIATIDADAGRHIALKLDGEDRAHISYQRSNGNGVKYARQTAAGWDIEALATGPQTGSYTSLGLDTQERAHIAFFDGRLGDLKLSRQQPRWFNYLPLASRK